MQSFFRSPVLRAFLALLAITLLSLAIWFVGPLLAFGDLRPLAGASVRAAIIVLCVLLAIFLLLEWILSPIIVTALCLALWHAGPVLALGSASSPWHPLEGEWPRATLIATIVIVYAIWLLIGLWRMVRSDEDFARKIFGLDKGARQQALARAEIRALQGKTQLALAELRQMRMTIAGRTGGLVALLRRVVEGRRYLYELPWYMVIGNPGAGKSSLLTNAGLTFPLAEQMQAAAQAGSDRGTLNCVWWFTNEAVLIDTAGRYTTPDDGAAPGGEPTAEGGSQAVNEAEWRGFLGLLRKARTRAPINGVLLAIDLSEVCRSDEASLQAHAARLRARLGELRQQLGVRFPVYVVLTKSDVLKGFNAYFATLGSESRAQVWGFTLPLDEHAVPRQEPQALAAEDAAPPVGLPLAEHLGHELQALQRRIAAGIGTRLQEVYDLDRRRALFLLPYELAALGRPLVQLLEQVFADSRFDTTQRKHMLRGVYFTSAAQPPLGPASAPMADRRALVPRLLGALSRQRASVRMIEGDEQLNGPGARSYFINDLLRRIVFPEAHLVRPNLRWEARFRLLRLLGHGLAIVLGLWFGAALLLSRDNNRAYLADVGTRSSTLRQHIQAAQVQQHPERIGGLLSEARALALHTGLDLSDPSSAYGYGLYSPPPIVAESRALYAHLQDHMTLPVVVHRMELRLGQALRNQDEVDAYETLRVYLLLHDRKRFESDKTAAADLRAWVMKDWQGKEAGDPTGSAASAGPTLAESFGHSAAMIDHLQALFSGQRLVQSSKTADAQLVKRVREFLQTRSASERLYERAKRAVANEAPRDFSLVRVLGPQAGAVFRHESGRSLEQGVPGLFTYDGYHQRFAKRLRELVIGAVDDDSWAMGRAKRVADDATADREKVEMDSLIEDIRRQYLQEYAQVWDAFLGDVRLRSAAEGDSMGFEVDLARQLAAADSPLLRLARQAARETTLSRPLTSPQAERSQSLLEQANAKLDRGAAALNDSMGLRPEQALERRIVDDNFSALREVVAGQPDPAQGPVVPPRVDAVSAVLNEHYTAMVVAQTAIAGGSLPPLATDSASKIQIEAGKLPEPFRSVLTDVGRMGTDKISRGAATILRSQARSQLDRLQGLLALMVTEPCRRNVAGRYPFAPSSQEVAADDFNAFFAAGGAADSYFTKYLQPLVDTSVRPWRYKNPDTANMMVGTEALAEGKAPQAAINGPTLLGELLRLLASAGPNPEEFAQVQAIRETYFREPGSKRMAWRQELQVAELDPTITELVVNVDGQVLRYAHGPVQPFPIAWPGPRGGIGVEMSVQPRLRADTALLAARGPWALMHLFEKARLSNGASGGTIGLEFDFDGRKAQIDIQNAGGANPISAEALRGFKCPGLS